MIAMFICTYKLIYIVEIVCSYESGDGRRCTVTDAA